MKTITEGKWWKSRVHFRREGAMWTSYSPSGSYERISFKEQDDNGLCGLRDVRHGGQRVTVEGAGYIWSE